MRRLDTMFTGLRIIETDVDFPNVNSNQTISGDITAAGVILGTHIFSFEPVSDATDIEDMLLQVMVVDTNLLRFTLNNPTGGAINPGTITMQFFMGEANPDIVEVV